MKRNCPKCGKEIEYKSIRGFKASVKNNSICRRCVSENSGFLDRYATRGKNTGSDNAFFGRKLTEEELFAHKERMKNRNQNSYKTPEFRQKISKTSSGSNNPMYGKTVYEVWVEKYGVKEADKRMALKNKKQSESSSGKNNPMYGKPSPNGSGNGWKGWYKEKYFRSLRELTYILQLEESGTNWISAESIRIPYKCPLGKDRTYSPDFLIGSKLIEIKPIRLQDTPLVSAKTSAAEEYCKKNNLTYEIVDVEIDNNLITKYWDSIKFAGNYKEKYEKWLKKTS